MFESWKHIRIICFNPRNQPKSFALFLKTYENYLFHSLTNRNDLFHSWEHTIIHCLTPEKTSQSIVSLLKTLGGSNWPALQQMSSKLRKSNKNEKALQKMPSPTTQGFIDYTEIPKRTLCSLKPFFYCIAIL